MPPLISLNVLGPVELTIDERPTPPALLWRKHLALLVYLTRASGRAVSRDHLVGLFWGDKPESSARHSLSEAVFELRRHLGAQTFKNERAAVRLEPGRIRLDTELFEDRLNRGDVCAAADLVRGEFMEGFSIADAWEFGEWLAGERRLWRESSVRALVEAASKHIWRGSTGAGVALAERASRLDDLSEPALRARMTARALEGDRASALAALDAWRERSRREYALEPSAETEALAERIRREKSWRPTLPQIEAEPPLRRWPLVGRESQMEALLREWQESVTRSQLRMAAICGPAGIGRTRLGEEVVARARLDGAHASVARAVPTDRSTISHPLQLLSAELSSQPTTIFFDDLHWLAPDTIRVFHALARDLHDRPLFLLLSAVTPAPTLELDALWSRLDVDIPGTVIHLGPLTNDAVRQLAEQALPSYSPHEIDRLTRRVQVDCAGIPFLVTSLLTAVQAGLELDPVAHAWPAASHTLDDTLPARLPETAVAAIRMSFWRLSEQARDVLIATAVLSEPCTPEALTFTTRMPRDVVGAALDELEWKRWLSADVRGYTFVTRLVRNVVATQMTTPGQRQRLIRAASPDAPPT